MIYLPEQNVGILHCPKTGGKFVRYALERLGVPIVVEPPECGTAENFSSWKPDIKYYWFVRHPAGWLFSYWADRMINGWGGDLHIGHTCESNDLHQFVKNVITKHPGFVTSLYDLYQSENGTWLKYESLVENLVTVLNDLGVEKATHEELQGYGWVNRCASLPQFSNISVLDFYTRKDVIISEQVAMKRYNYL